MHPKSFIHHSGATMEDFHEQTKVRTCCFESVLDFCKSSSHATGRFMSLVDPILHTCQKIHSLLYMLISPYKCHMPNANPIQARCMVFFVLPVMWVLIIQYKNLSL